jgi:hypothetical protein
MVLPSEFSNAPELGDILIEIRRRKRASDNFHRSKAGKASPHPASWHRFVRERRFERMRLRTDPTTGVSLLARVERAFRCLKTVDLDIRPIRHWTAERVRAHVFLCMLAYHVEWHPRRALAPLLFHDTDIAAARAERPSPVAKTEPSQTAKTKKAVKRNPAGQPVMDFAGLIAHLGTRPRNAITTNLQKGRCFTLHTRPTAIQEAAFQLLDIDPTRVQ